MSNGLSIDLHKPEEALSVSALNALHDASFPVERAPIVEYFEHTQSLIGRLLKPEFRSDEEVLSLILLGVVSAAELYFRSAITVALELCPAARKVAERAVIPIGSVKYYGTSYKWLAMSTLEHKSLAGSQEIVGELRRLLGINVEPKSSLATALYGFDLLCEFRHAAVHSRGFLSHKGLCELELAANQIKKLRLSQDVTFDLIKLSHNAVRSFNRYVFHALLQRWLSDRWLIGSWRKDRAKFSKLYSAFAHPDESAFGSDARAAYNSIKSAIHSRFSAA